MWYEPFTDRLPREEGLTPLGEIAAALKQAYGGEELPPGPAGAYFRPGGQAGEAEHLGVERRGGTGHA